MSGEILLISKRDEDLRFWQNVAKSNSMDFRIETVAANIRAVLRGRSDVYVFWDDESDEDQTDIERALLEEVPAVRVFAVTDSPINRQPDRLKPPAFGHHIFRRYEEPAPFLYRKLIEAAVSGNPFGLGRYFPEGHQGRKFTLTSSGERMPALDRIQGFFEDFGVASKIARVGTDASDELMMNAIFDAPFDPAKGGYYRRDTDRSAEFALEGREQVEIQVAACEQFLGVSVTDRFGSLKRDVVLEHLFQNFHEEEYVPPTGEPNAGLGLHRINQLALALLFVSRPGERTEVMVFFGNTKTYREFRLGFCFFSIFSE